MNEQRQDDQLESTYSSSVLIWDVSLRTCRQQWTIGRASERGSRIYVLIAWHDDDDDGLAVRVFTNGPGDQGSIPGRVIPNTQKMVLDASLLNISIIRYGSRVKWSNPGKGVAPSPTPRCRSYRKGNLRVTLDYGRQLYFIYMYVCVYIYMYIYIYKVSSKDFKPFWERKAIVEYFC